MNARESAPVGNNGRCPDGAECGGFQVWRTNHEDGPAWSWACNGGLTLYPFSTMDAAVADHRAAHIGSSHAHGETG